MAATSSPVRDTRLSKRMKRRRETMVREKIAAMGGTFLKINWKKRTAHFLTSTGNKKTAYAA